MTKQDPAERITIKEIKRHPWFRKETASQDDVEEYFYDLKPGSLVDQEDLETKRALAMQNIVVMRSSAGAYVGPDEEELEFWKDLTYQ